MILLFFDISGGELLVILAAVFVVFGPKKVPEIARQIGKGMNELRKATSDITREFQEGITDTKDELNKVKETIEVSNQRLSKDYVSGPSELNEDIDIPKADKESQNTGSTSRHEEKTSNPSDKEVTG